MPQGWDGPSVAAAPPSRLQYRWYESFEPLLPAFSGIVLGSVLHLFIVRDVPKDLPEWQKLAVDVSARVYIFYFAVVMWAIMTAFCYRRRLYGGGRERLDIMPFRYILGLFATILVLVFGGIFLAGGHVVWFWTVTAATLSLIAGEVGFEWRFFVCLDP